VSIEAVHIYQSLNVKDKLYDLPDVKCAEKDKEQQGKA
jgi:hypothetical protein